MVFLFSSRRLFLFLLIAGLEETKNLRGGNVLRLRVVQIRFNDADLAKTHSGSSRKKCQVKPDKQGDFPGHCSFLPSLLTASRTKENRLQIRKTLKKIS